MYKWTTALLILLSVTAARAESFRVRHDHNPWGQCTGELVITGDGIAYHASKKKDSRDWKWVDIQTFDRRSPTSFSILTYEDRKMALGADRRFNFTLLPGQEALGQSTFQMIVAHLTRPPTDRIPRPIQPEYQVAVKHLHTFGGCEGVLLFSKEWIVYRTAHAPDARSWKRDRDVESVWSLNPYQLEIRVYEEHAGSFGGTRRFRFQLKEPLDENYYRQLRRELLPAR